ncbi:MAG: ATP-binding protein [Gammaproteobacteria bacterium]
MPTSRRRGISMGTRMLLFSSLFLLALPWLGYRYIDQMKNFLLQGQEDAQLLTARALATVLQGGADLFYPLDQPVELAAEQNALYVYPLQGSIEVDAYAGDWDELRHQAKSFGTDYVIYDRSDGSGQPVAFNLLLGEYGQYIYAFLQVQDKQVVYRHPRYRRLDHSDHVRLEIITPQGDTNRLILTTDGEGQVSVYEMNPDWKTPTTGQPVNALYGIWRERKGGYDLELRLPSTWLGKYPQMMISVANVDSAMERRINSVIATQQKHHRDIPNALITRSPELDRILQALGSTDADVCVVDKYRRVRGVYGGNNETTLCSQKDTVSSELVDAALAGNQSVLHYQNTMDVSVIVAAHPVYANGNVLGAVMVEKNSRHILGLQRESLLQIIIGTFVVFLVAILSLMLFAAWLAYRIRRLQREASQAIDPEGRVVTEHIHTDQYAADEIGQLSRDISSLLSRLKSYTGFLESIPRTLRHEILNPVNTISMSLQRVESDSSNESMLNSARKATQQLELIVHGLTEAAHIEDALTQDEYTRFDLAAMVREYVVNSSLKHGDDRFEYHGPDSGVFVKGNDLRIAQLLDKLKDNALDFSAGKEPVLFELDRRENQVELSIINQGPAMPEDVLEGLFHGMISRRAESGDKPHLGIGLYIANRIARQHEGQLSVVNLAENKGVKVSILLDMID